MIFQDREEAGKKLAVKVKGFVSGSARLPARQGLVLGIPRGGVVTAKVVAEKLGWPLDVLRAKKIGAPGNPELAIGAKVRSPYPKLSGVKQVVLVDDGVATGHTVEAGVKWLKANGVEKVIVAVPVAAKDSAKKLKKLAPHARGKPEWVCLLEPENFYAVGQFYRHFPQVTDEEVREILV